VDDLSGGRLVLGVGAGWQEREHAKFGHDLLETQARFERFEEGLQVISRLLSSGEPVDFEGEYYKLNQAILLPRPARPGGPPLLIGGNGSNRTLPLAARFAAEWNGTHLTPERFARLNRRLDDLLVEQGRTPKDVRRSMMTGVVFGRDDRELHERIRRWGGGDRTAEVLREEGIIVGTASEIRGQLSILEDLGLQRIMLQWSDMDDLAHLEAMANAIL
jgi:alkanesulfonate monooxygenase SsuD/methylene tetrahydromethanopterin reductase-like flavin-dependent oxidoreductase (luciferase family)